jgi:hypothetical protein
MCVVNADGHPLMTLEVGMGIRVSIQLFGMLRADTVQQIGVICTTRGSEPVSVVPKLLTSQAFVVTRFAAD